MKIQMLYSKIHRATITDANLNYQGSITIDRNIAKSANLHEGIKVDIVNINNGERFSTYVIYGGEGEFCLNGGAARKAHIGDKVIIIAYGLFDESELKNYQPYVVMLDDENKICSTKRSV